MALIGTYKFCIPYGPTIPMEGLPFAAPTVPDQIVEIPGVYAKVVSLSGGKSEMNAILSVCVQGLNPEAPAGPVPTVEDLEEEHDIAADPVYVMREIQSFSIRFVPQLDSDNFLRQAYLLFAADPRCATLVSDE